VTIRTHWLDWPKDPPELGPSSAANSSAENG